MEVYNLSSLAITAGSTDNGYVGYYAKNVYTATRGSSYLTTQDGYIFYNDDGTYYLMGYTGSDTALTLPTLTINGETLSYSVYQYAFFYNIKITSIVISDSVTSIGDSAFFDCTSLESIIIPGSVTSIDDSAFYNCTLLTSVYYSGTADEWSTIAFNGSYSDPTYNGATLYYYAENDGTVTDAGNYWYYDGDGEIVDWTIEEQE